MIIKANVATVPAIIFILFFSMLPSINHEKSKNRINMNTARKNLYKTKLK